MIKSNRIPFLMVALVLALGLALPLAGCNQAPATQDATSTQEETATKEEVTEAHDGDETEAQTAGLDFYDPSGDYKLQQVTILSRHNIRAPLSATGSALDQATPYTWIDWTSNASELTMRGGTQETMMGQYVRKWLEAEGLIPENYQPEPGAVRFYANSKQRTIATAQFFSSGFLPVANVDLETHVDYDTMDPVFSPSFTFMSDSYRDAALEQITTMDGAKGIEDVASDLADSYSLIEDVVDYTGSDAYKAGEIGDLDTTDTQITLELGKEPATSGSLKTACQLSDALVLQYYESPSATDAAFGHDLTFDEWRRVSQSKDAFIDILYTAPLIATNIAHPLLQEIGSEMDAQGRLFSFLCGHDSNLASVLAALEAEEYELPGAIEVKTPIGSKLVFERWANADGDEFGRVRLLYQSVDQLREGSMLSGTEAPMSCDMSFKGLEKNEDGLYKYEDLRARIDGAAARYDEIAQEYGATELDQAA